MHAGFLNLRSSMPMNCRARLPGKGINPQVAADIARIKAIWRDCRQKFGSEGDFLFGNFTIADAMFAPVVIRFVTYGVELDPVSQAYADRIWQMPEMQSWIEAGCQEEEILTQFEV
jgi:glutathione S-transferase